MTDVGLAAALMGGLGLLFGIILAVAYRFLRVEEDPLLGEVAEMLPGSNCGACGQPGCNAFAEKIVVDGVAPGGCTVASPELVEQIAELLGVDAGGGNKNVARLHCAGGKSRGHQMAAYAGYDGCRAAHIVSGGGKECAWGCLGLSDCDAACKFDAIKMNEDGLPVVDPELCTACGDCVEACPRDLFEILPLDVRVVVQCSAPLAGDAAMAICDVACDACGRCAQDAAPGLITMKNSLPVVDYESDIEASPKATLRCPTGAIQWVGEKQFTEQTLVRLGVKRHAQS